ncbi:MAG: homospermidine synthase [Elusimicrobia bacterium CG08_land_8_20_14_0_20_51_18]|nr:MAG: homospermidine synthase [Elusimicrobia bacterium CG08_land_8_20_14_0_20_51_18]
MKEFKNKILFIGYGSVAQCALPVLLKLVKVPAGNITVMDFEDKRRALKPWLSKGVKFVRDRVTEKNMGKLLGKYLKSGDMLIDLAWNIDCREILQWCHDRGVLYVNTSTELWDPYKGAVDKEPAERTLYVRHMAMRKMVSQWKTPGPTAVIEHGANPGLISHFAKKGLIDIANKLLAEKKAKGAKAEKLRQLVKDRTFNELAMNLGVKVIHVSERDTQISDKPKLVDEFVNTWSVEGFREEGVAPAELGWGTHEKELPPMACRHKSGPKNQICLARMGMNTWISTWVPNYCIHGMLVRHGEAFTLSDKLTVWKKGKAVYRPTVHYAYCPSDAAIASLNELRGYDYKLQPKVRIMGDEIIEGYDILGALLMGHEYDAWWTGTILNIHESRKLVPHQNATTIQVAIGVISAAMWIMDNPEKGVLAPDDLPHDYILKIARPWLGKLHSAPSSWTPLKHYTNAFKGYNNPYIDRKDPWQFKNFLITDSD